jgi:secreted PhoX family phosphatase
MRRFNRRRFLSGSLSAGAALAMQRLVARGEAFGIANHADLIATKGNGAYGVLRSKPANNSGEMLLALPEGFQYAVFGKTGEKMSDGNQTPRAHDGMAAFNVNGELRLIRNHEINNQVGKMGVAIGNPGKSYDPMAGGGTTTLVIDPETRELKRHFISLSGTLHNCAGGPTPWGSWISCEETLLGTEKFKDQQGNDRGGFTKNHGYCFEVFAANNDLKKAEPLKAMGRFVHEAIAVDPQTGIVYETEDRGSAGFYRFIPKTKGKLGKGGRLQMLAIKDSPKFDTRAGQKAGRKLDVVWVDIDDPDPANAAAEESSVYGQGLAKGGATFARLEGCWYGNGGIFFTATSGGDKRRGQVWQYTPLSNNDGVLMLLFESPDAQVLDGPDNLCVSPRGGLVICEDGGNEQFVRGLTPEGRIFDFARNIVPGFEMREFAGATFSPDGRTLFLNIQTPGLTFAVWGPWREGAL